MKLMIASDLHGSALYTEQLLQAYRRERPEKLCLLGDLLYHGPRNDLPEGYAPKEVISLLNAEKDHLLCVRGNCDAEVDQMVLDFPISETHQRLSAEGWTFFLSHGHHLDDLQTQTVRGDVVLSGHTHIPAKSEKEGVWFLNPGSVSIPKENSPHGYMIYEDGRFMWKNLAGETYDTLTI